MLSIDVIMTELGAHNDPAHEGAAMVRAGRTLRPVSLVVSGLLVAEHTTCLRAPVESAHTYS